MERQGAEVIASPWMRWLVWLRVLGDVIFAIGAAMMFLFTLRAIIVVKNLK
jgi:nitric oxide reductase subunit B